MALVKKGFDKLVFDVGAHKGDDIAVYLSLGFRVVAIEANPELIPLLQKRFNKELDNERLVILNYAIGPQNNIETKLYVNEDTSKSSLFGKQELKSVPVFTKTLASLIEDFGVPHYCKIDIEGADLFALDSLNESIAPSYISVEISGDHINAILDDPKILFYTLDRLYSLGYTRFKLVDQERLVVLANDSFYKQNLQPLQRVNNKVRTLLGLDRRSRFLKKFNLEKDAEVSGLPSELLEKKWVAYQEVKRLAQFHFKEFASVVRSSNLIFWVDLHATK